MTNTAQRLINKQNQLGLRVAAHLDAACKELPHDIQARLSAARTRAVAAKIATQIQAQTTHIVGQSNAAALLHLGGDEGLSIWNRLASLLPLIALVAGLALIQHFVDNSRVDELTEVDSAMLSDDLPPTAYADPGFLQFLKMPLTESEAADQTKE
jgi:Protein of unknown function (DUF3619)